jgi:hypothetical protein
MSNKPRVLVVIVGAIAVLTALCGLYYNSASLSTALCGGFSDLVGQHEVTYFYPAFYVMSGICIVCYLLLLVVGVDLLRARLRWSRFLTGVLIFEVVYFFSIGVLWLMPNVGMSVGAATGVANGGLMVQFIILFPLWAPLVLRWAKKKSEQDRPVD